MDSDSILPLSFLARLRVLNLSHNRIDDLKTVCEMTSYLANLIELDLRENPCNSGGAQQQHTAVTHKKYRDRVISASRSLQKLDEKEIPDNQREYLHSLAEQKRIKRAAAAATADGTAEQPAREMTEEEAKFAALHKAPSFPYAPKVLTLRTSTVGGSAQSVHGVGGFGAGNRHTMHQQQQQQHSHAYGSNSSTAIGNYTTYQPQHQQYQPSPPPPPKLSSSSSSKNGDAAAPPEVGGGDGWYC